jgi:ABC-2 type transport system ATP-binding protein
MIARLADAGKAVLISSHILTELAEICHTVGIIEQGRLLAVGSVDDISSRAQVRSTVRVRVLDGVDRLARWLEERGDVDSIRTDGELALFVHDGDRASEAALLREIVQEGFDVVEFGAKASNLEDVFLHVTKGRVQ